jgi:hypothetical protein
MLYIEPIDLLLRGYIKEQSEWTGVRFHIRITDVRVLHLTFVAEGTSLDKYVYNRLS